MDHSSGMVLEMTKAARYSVMQLWPGASHWPDFMDQRTNTWWQQQIQVSGPTLQTVLQHSIYVHLDQLERTPLHSADSEMMHEFGRCNDENDRT